MAEQNGKYLGRYNTPEELEKAYGELYQVYTRQGQELGQIRQAQQQAADTLQQFQQFYQQAAPVVQWVEQNKAGLQHYGTWLQRAQAGTLPQQQATQAQVNAQQNGVNLASLLTPEERQQLGASIFQQQLLPAWKAWQAQIAREIQQYGQAEAARVRNEFNQQQSAHTNVLWKAMEYLSPSPEHMARVKRMQEEALRFATQPQLDPMQMAEERLRFIDDNTRMSGELKSLRDAEEARQKAAVQSLGSHPSLGYETPAERPKNSGERFANVMNQVTRELGHEAVQHLSGAPAPAAAGAGAGLARNT